MFNGEYTPKVDDKWRFFLPSKLRDDFAEKVIVSITEKNGCLAIYTPEAFKDMTRQMSAAFTTVQQQRDAERVWGAGSSTETLDKQGRISIPQSLREYAGLDKDIVVVGAFTRVEIWNAKDWHGCGGDRKSVFAALTREMPLGMVSGIS